MRIDCNNVDKRLKNVLFLNILVQIEFIQTTFLIFPMKFFFIIVN